MNYAHVLQSMPEVVVHQKGKHYLLLYGADSKKRGLKYKGDSLEVQGRLEVQGSRKKKNNRREN